MKNERVIFVLVDTQIIDEQMLEDINNVLNSGTCLTTTRLMTWRILRVWAA